jgi:sec-independent protein translocase protein TatA
MFDIGGGELILIVLAFLVLFGPKKVPEVTKMLGKGFRKIKEAQTELKSHLKDIEKEIENDSPNK